MGNINDIINETPTLDSVQKEFYAVMIAERKAKILDYSMEKLMKLEGIEEESLQDDKQQYGIL